MAAGRIHCWHRQSNRAVSGTFQRPSLVDRDWPTSRRTEEAKKDYHCHWSRKSKVPVVAVEVLLVLVVAAAVVVAAVVVAFETAEGTARSGRGLAEFVVHHCCCHFEPD